ncbi:MAG: tRNA (N6-isopentenyl adenosine(37)-C2)-methylthiotransferase MiaB [Spirochaetes bacterium]|nr:tRNA (N6-isopentenyl adenosine(37)-C2)-methylthiotransferase MiaB [Spirochaetota bacterium]
MRKKFHIETFGCQMNKSDSELMVLSLSRSGFDKTDIEAEADIHIFNTCSVRQHAEDRVISRIENMRAGIKPESIIVITGCMAQNRKDKLTNGIADIIIGPYQGPKIGEILDNYFKDKTGNNFLSQSYNDFSPRIDFGLTDCKDDIAWHKWITITHGCENFCSYCIVPYVRGPLISFPSDTIIKYAGELAAKGITEVTLLGQNVNQYGMDSDIPFYRLLEKIAGIREFRKVGFLTSHPKDFDDNIIYVIRDNENISKAVHLPFQSGSNTILKQMNRQYTRERYLEIMEKIDKTLEEYSVSTDIIVGFPGETEEDFNATLDVVRKVRFDEAFTYAYSPREGTASYHFEEKLTREEKIERLNTLIDVHRSIVKEKLTARIGRHENMTVENVSKRSEEEVIGRTSLNHPVVISGGEEDIGKRLEIKIGGLRGATLLAERIN